ncbi:alpha/beta fold hydrolase [Ideonella livida]|uniref:Alpha/beta hydrolase n=1 Tax=Ideonella livida TaxID=2707176 RepID=A0A7C9PHU3_9BURK|nr:alpha/beta hydrolase [Ideonella livida]NDY92148.1 alpha/beta hydrolase [Ideonella livida]
MRITVRHRTAYAYTGGATFDASLPCVVFLHGALHDHSVWTLAARWFAHHGHAVLALDLPGHGRSEGSALSSVEDLADWVGACLSTVSVEQAAVVGHSMGSLIALEMAARHPGLTTKLVLLGTAFPMRVSDSLLEQSLTQPDQALKLVNALSHSSLGAKPSDPGPGTWLHGANLALMRRNMDRSPNGAALFHHDFSLCNRYQNGWAATAQVQCSVTVVAGARDQMTPPKAARLLADALKAPVVMVEAGHALMQEAPDSTLAALQHALRTTQPG